MKYIVSVVKIRVIIYIMTEIYTPFSTPTEMLKDIKSY